MTFVPDFGGFITKEGGIATRLLNKTGAPSVKGTLVAASTSYDSAVELAAANDMDCVGVLYESGVADGDPVLVVIGGVADVLLEDGSAATRGYWVRTSVSDAGRADATNATPPGLVLQHFAEIGHCIQSVGAGVSVLARVVLHFN